MTAKHVVEVVSEEEGRLPAEKSQNSNEFEFGALENILSAVNDGEENKTWSRYID